MGEKTTIRLDETNLDRVQKDMLRAYLSPHRANWLIVGEDSGRGHRSIDLQWARLAVKDSRRAGVALFMKQLGGPAADGKFAEAIAGIEEAVPGARQVFLGRGLARQDFYNLAKIAEPQPHSAKHILEQIKGAANPREAKRILRQAAESPEFILSTGEGEAL